MFVKNQAITGFPFELLTITGDPITTGTVTGYYLLDGGVQTALTGTATHEGNGIWSWSTIPATATNGLILELLFLHASGRASFTIKLSAEPYGEVVTGTPSETAICNIALVRIGQQTITSLTDTTNRALICNLLYEHTRDRVFQEVQPTCAVERVALTRLLTTPTYEFTYAYQVPVNVISVLDASDSDIAWKKEGDTVLCDESTLSMRLLKRERDTTKWSPLLSEAVIAALMTSFAGAFIKTPAVVQALMQAETLAIAKASAAEGAESGTPEKLESTTLIDVRDTY